MAGMEGAVALNRFQLAAHTAVSAGLGTVTAAGAILMRIKPWGIPPDSRQPAADNPQHV